MQRGFPRTRGHGAVADGERLSRVDESTILNQNPLARLLPPATDEVFNSSNHYLARLQAFALGQGFAVVTGKVHITGTPRWQFQCIYHSTRNQNNRRLEPKMARDGEGSIIIRKRNGHV